MAISPRFKRLGSFTKKATATTPTLNTSMQKTPTSDGRIGSFQPTTPSTSLAKPPTSPTSSTSSGRLGYFGQPVTSSDSFAKYSGSGATAPTYATGPAPTGGTTPSGNNLQTAGGGAISPTDRLRDSLTTKSDAVNQFNAYGAPSGAAPTGQVAGTGAISPEERIRWEQAREKQLAQEALNAGTDTSGAFNQASATGPSRLEELQGQYLALLTPSEREQYLLDELSDFQQSAQLGISGKEGQGRGIPLDLIRGEQSLMAEQAGIKEQTLLDKIANATAARQASATALGAQLGFETEASQRAIQEKQFAEQMKAQNQPFEFNGNLVQFDQATGKLVTVAEGLPVAADPITISEGQTIIDPNTGQVIYSSSKTKSPITVSPGQTIIDPNTGQVLFQAANKPESLPGSVQEYLFAAGQGYTGSYTDFQAQSGGGTEYSAAQAKAVGFYDRSVNAEANVKAALDGVGSGFFLQGTLPSQLDRFRGEKYKLYEQAAETWIKAILRQESGAAIPEEEINSYMETYFPRVGDSGAVIQQKEAARLDAMNALLVGVPNTGTTGSAPIPYNPDVFNSYQEYQDYINFGNVGSDTNSAAIQTVSQKYPDNSYGGQCGRFVNKLTGLGVGDSFASKMAKTDPSIGTAYNPPRSGDVFVMPYKEWGHIGFVEQAVPKQDGTFDLYVIDSNWGLNEKVQRHVINSGKITGYARPTINV